MPEAILLKDVEQLGSKGTVVDVSKGYLRNYLIPRKLAQPATKGALEAARRTQVAQERAVEQATSRAQDQAELLNRTVLTLSPRAGGAGRLFSPAPSQAIVDAAKDARGTDLDRRKVPHDEPIPHVGTS